MSTSLEISLSVAGRTLRLVAGVVVVEVIVRFCIYINYIYICIYVYDGNRCSTFKIESTVQDDGFHIYPALQRVIYSVCVCQREAEPATCLSNFSSLHQSKKTSAHDDSTDDWRRNSHPTPSRLHPKTRDDGWMDARKENGTGIGILDHLIESEKRRDRHLGMMKM